MASCLECRKPRSLVRPAPHNFLKFSEHQGEQRRRHNNRLFNANVATRYLVDQPLGLAAMYVDTKKLRALYENRCIGIADGRVLELPDGISASLCVQDEAPVECIKSGDASSKVTT